MQFPKAAKKEKYLTIHNDTRLDPYFWLNDRENSEVIAYLEAENAFFKAQTQHTEAGKQRLFEEMVARFQQTDMSVPVLLNGFWYYTRYEEGAEYPLHCRRADTPEATEEIMLHVPQMAENHSYYAIGGKSISPNNEWLAYGVDTVSRRIYTIHFKNLKTGETLPLSIPNTTGSATWANDNKTLFYQVKDEALRSYKIFRHQLGTNAENDVCVWHETDEVFGTYIFKSRSKKYLIIGSYSKTCNEYRFLEADAPEGDFRLFYPRQPLLEYSLDHFKGEFYLLSNWQAQNFRLLKTAERATDLAHWQEILPHREDILVENVDFFDEFILLAERKEGISRLRLRSWDASDDHYIDFGETVYSSYPHINLEVSSKTIRVGYTSLTTPNSVYEYDVANRTLHLLKQEAVLKGTHGEDFDSSRYFAERLHATASDGTIVPISLVYRKNLFEESQKKGDTPLLLYGYGSYGHSIDVYFSAARLSLLDRGFVFAIAHVRGGQELGRHWYENGKMLNKQNTFSDFITCAEFLLAKNYVAKDNLFAMGGSAGGLLMGVVINMRPDLWRGVVAAVPFVDVVTTMLDESIPLTTGEFEEWGNPKEEKYYHYIKSYSPYDNIAALPYPAMLVTTGLHDSQVQYWEPAKWVAKLRDYKTNPETPLYLWCNMSTGHGGASGRWERFKEVAMEYAFLLDLANKHF